MSADLLRQRLPDATKLSGWCSFPEKLHHLEKDMRHLKDHVSLPILIIVITLAWPMLGADALVGVYHEASCPSVDRTRMIRLKRAFAESIGLLPAVDCHPGVRVRYLGISGASFDASTGGSADSPNVNRERAVEVRSYTKSDGTRVEAYTRSGPHRD